MTIQSAEEERLLLELQIENDEASIREIEDRKRIQHLLTLVNPGVKEITYFQDDKEKPMTAFPGVPGGSFGGGSTGAMGQRSCSESVRTMPVDPHVRNQREQNAAVASLTGAVRECQACDEPQDGGASGGASANAVAAAKRGSLQRAPSAARAMYGNRVGASKKSRHRQMGAEKKRDAGVLRTIFVPDERQDTLLVMIQNIRARQQEQETLAAEKLFEMMEKRRLNEEEEQVMRIRDEERIQRLEDDLLQKNEMLVNIMKQFLSKESQALASTTSLVEDNARLNIRLQNTQQEMANIRTKTARKLQRINEDADRKSSSSIRRIRAQAADKESNLTSVRNEFSISRAQYDRSIAKMSKKLEDANKKYQGLITRRKLEATGYHHDIEKLKSELDRLERALMQSLEQQKRGYDGEGNASITIKGVRAGRAAQLGQAALMARRQHHIRERLHQLRGRVDELQGYVYLNSGQTAEGGAAEMVAQARASS